VQTVTVPSTGGLASTISGTDVTCFGTPTGTATASPVGGNPGYTYSWSPSGGTNATANNLVAGTYTCVVTDGSGCTSVSQITITEPTQLTASSAGFNVTCNGVCDGQVVTIPAGGTPNYSFLWNTGCTTAACNSVCAGTYTVTITDGNGCTTTDVATVTQPAAITITTGMTQATCGQSDGSASANASGGTGAFTYQWINGPAGANYNNIPAGTYSVIATDANGCSDTSAVTVTNLNGVLLSSCGVTDVSCFGLSDGSVNVCASQGNPGYTYSWSPNVSATASATNVAAGNYVVTVTDAIGCIAVITVTVTEPPQLTMTASALPAIVCAGTPSQINAAPAGGSPGYTVGWMPGPLTGSSVNVTPTATTTYTAAVTDANGCTATAITTVTVSALPVSQFSADTTQGCAPLCVNFSDLSSVSLPSTVTSWSWDFGDNNNSTQQSPNHCYATPGVYSVTLLVTTNDGCSHTLSLNNYINVFGSPTAAFTASPQPTTILTPTINFTDMSTGADTWLWSFGDLNNSTSNLQNPTYTYSDPICYQVSLEVSSQNGCTDSTSEIICIDPDVSIYVPNTFTPNDDGINETFIPITTGINPDRYEFWVFDRWGNLIFYTDDLNEGWNGRVQGHDKLCQIDTYVWKVKCVDVLDKKHNLIGHVNLIR
jgi:gliding motility-associated-like protein